CPYGCDTACIDCLLNYRNAYYHKNLDRRRAVELLNHLGQTLTSSHEIPARLPDDAEREEPTNVVENQLNDMLLRAGFPRPQAQKTVDLGLPLGKTLPDFYYDDPNDFFEGLCIYL